MKNFYSFLLASILATFFLHSTVALAGAEENSRAIDKDEKDVLSQPRNDSAGKNEQKVLNKDKTNPSYQESSSASESPGAGNAGSSETGSVYQGRRKTAE